MQELYHHGILGQKWGKRNGPPYPLSGGDYSRAEKKAMYKKRTSLHNIYNKRHFDSTISADKDTLSTLSYDPNRTQNTDLFFAAYKKLDKHQYNALFNKPVPKTLYDENGNAIGTGQCLKYRINNNVKNDMKVASEDSGANIFKQLYSSDRDFYNFVKDRMVSLYPEDKYVFKGYKKAMKVIDKINKDDKYTPTEDEVQTMYRLFNYVLPNDGGGNMRIANDVLKQRTKFFNKCKEAGYGAVLDVNDAMYGGFKTSAPVIIFDMSQVVPKNVEMTKMLEQRVSVAITIGRKVVGI